MYSILIGETVSYKEAMLNNGRRESSQEYIAILMVAVWWGGDLDILVCWSLWSNCPFH